MVSNQSTHNAPNPAWDMECALVGALLLCPEELPAVLPIVRPDDLSHEPARRVYEAITFMAGGGVPIDAVLLARELKQRGTFEAVGGVTGLSAFTDATASGANAKHYAECVAKAARERRQSAVIVRAYQELSAGGADHDGICRDLIAELQAANASAMRRREAKLASEIILDCLDTEKTDSFVSTGYRALDGVHGGGLSTGSLTVIGAAPSVGKSQFSINLATRMKREDAAARVLYLSLEMAEAELMCRFVALLGEATLGAIKTIFHRRAHGHTLDAYGWQFEQGARRVGELPLRMLCGGMDADGLRETAARYAGRYDVLIVDYLQRVAGQKGQKTLERVEAASRACKDIAVEHGAAVIAIASLNRDGYRDRSVKPDLAHLRECGNIEFDADNVWMLWREKASGTNQEALELHVRKQRNGPLDVVNFEFDLPVGRIWESGNEM